MEDKYFSLGCQLCMQRNFIFFEASSQQSICHTAVYLHLGYRFLLGQTVTRLLVEKWKRFLVPCWGNLPSTVLCAVGITSRALLRRALPAGSKILWVQRDWGETGVDDLYFHEASSWETRMWLINWMGCVFSCHWKKNMEWIKFLIMSRRICFPVVVVWFHLQHLICVEDVWIGFCIYTSTALMRTH